jgi:hypothetical protein
MATMVIYRETHREDVIKETAQAMMSAVEEVCDELDRLAGRPPVIDDRDDADYELDRYEAERDGVDSDEYDTDLWEV